MTASDQEEAFIRAIVDAPGNDAPRLAYADRLDERADPRGAWLRAELVWAAPWRAGRRPADAPELLAQANACDAGWVARVGRPPLGVCCDHLEIRRRRVEFSGSDIDRVTTSRKLHFPEQLRAFLKNYNGGRGRLNGYPHPNIPGEHCELQPWLSAVSPKDRPHTDLLRWLDRYLDGPRAYRSLIPLCAADAGHYEAFAIGSGARNFGHVYHVHDFHLNDPPGKPTKVASSLAEFLASILIEVPLAVHDDEA